MSLKIEGVMKRDDKTVVREISMVREMTFPKYEYQSPETGSDSVSGSKSAGPTKVFEGLRNLTAT